VSPVQSPDAGHRTTDPAAGAAPDRAAVLEAAFRGYRAAHPRAYLRDAAVALAVSELELLLATRADETTRLRDDDWGAFMHALPALGRVWTMTRNDQAVIEREGTYEGVMMRPYVGQVVSPTIDLRCFPTAWAHAVAVPGDERTNAGASIQLFDRHGTSVHKIRFAADGDADAWRALVGTWQHAEPYAMLPLCEPPAPAPLRSLETIDVAAFRSAWDALTDTHQFFGLLRQHELSREQAFVLAGTPRARRTVIAALETVWHAARDAAETIMIFAGNPGMLQIHIGVLTQVVRTPGWLNVMDDGVNVHVDETGLVSAWVVRKPTADGPVHSLELFNAQGQCVLMLFAKRAEGEPEPAWWATLLQALPETVSV